MGYRPTDEERELEGQWWVIQLTAVRCVALFNYGRFMVDGEPWPLDEVKLIRRVHLYDMEIGFPNKTDAFIAASRYLDVDYVAEERGGWWHVKEAK